MIRTQVFRLSFMVFAAVGLGRVAQAAPIELLTFQINGLAILQGNTPEFTGQAAWVPSISLGPIGVRGEIGLTNQKNNAGNRFFATNYEAFVTLGLLPILSVEAGGGLSTWFDTGASNPVISGYLVFSVPFLIKRIFAGYSRVMGSAGVNEVKLGAGFSF